MWIIQITFNTDRVAFSISGVRLVLPVKKVTFTAHEFESMNIDDEHYFRIQHGFYKSAEFVIKRSTIQSIEIL